MYTGKFKKKNGELIFNSEQDKLLYDILLDKLKDGQVVEMYIDLVGVDHSKAQLAKVHVCIREIAKESGYTFDEVKEIIKDASGLTGKSFADCSRDDLMLAIESCVQIGREQFNLNL
jgi:hypothetical protein